MIWWYLGSSAVASDALTTCCNALGATLCPATLAAVGPGSKQTSRGDEHVVDGVWMVACDARPRFVADGRVTTAGTAAPGTVITPMQPQAAQCFDAACQLPREMCVRYDGTRVLLARCDTGEVAEGPLWTGPLRDPRGAVIIGGRMLESQQPPRPPAAEVAPVAAPTRAQPAPLDPKVPAAPPTPCKAVASLRQPSNDQVDLGDEEIVAGNAAGAADRYRAAITINRCNAFAWAALGEALLNHRFPTEAIRPLQHANALMPRNLHASILLGAALEHTGDRAAARAVYLDVLAQQPGYVPATEGLMRVQ